MYSKENQRRAPIFFKPLTESHFPLLLKWLQTPHVRKWWDKDIDWNLNLIAEKFGTYVQGYKIQDNNEKPVYSYIIYISKTPIGYIQFYNAYDFPREDNVSLDALPRSLAGLDIFVGEEDFIGKGIGSKVLELFSKEYVFKKFDACFVDPDSTNIDAIKSYERAGFKKIKTLSNESIVWMIKEKWNDKRIS